MPAFLLPDLGEFSIVPKLDLGRAELLRDALLPPLLLELGADLQLQCRVERTRARGQDRALGLDQVPAELRLDRLRDDALAD